MEEREEKPRVDERGREFLPDEKKEVGLLFFEWAGGCRKEEGEIRVTGMEMNWTGISM